MYDYKRLPVDLVAAFFVGLRTDSRIKMAMAGESYRYKPDTMLLAMAVDALNILVWSKTKAAEKGEGRPESITAALFGDHEEKEPERYEHFYAGADFEARRKQILESITNGN